MVSVTLSFDARDAAGASDHPPDRRLELGRALRARAGLATNRESSGT